MKLFGILEQLKGAFVRAFESEASKLGVPHDFPLQFDVALSPDKYPPGDDADDGFRIKSAKYIGNNSWQVSDIVVVPEMMGTGMWDAGPKEILTTDELVAAFDQHVDEFPAQRMIYGPVHYPEVRDKLLSYLSMQASHDVSRVRGLDIN
jgi:hypothetical protein